MFYQGRLGYVAEETFQLPGVAGPSSALVKALPGEPKDDWSLYSVLAGLLAGPLVGAALSPFHMPAGIIVVLALASTLVGFVVPINMGGHRGRAKGCLTIKLTRSGKGLRRGNVAQEVSASAAPRPLEEVLAGVRDGSVTITGLSGEEIDEVCAALMKAVPSS